MIYHIIVTAASQYYKRINQEENKLDDRDERSNTHFTISPFLDKIPNPYNNNILDHCHKTNELLAENAVQPNLLKNFDILDWGKDINAIKARLILYEHILYDLGVSMTNHMPLENSTNIEIMQHYEGLITSDIPDQANPDSNNNAFLLQANPNILADQIKSHICGSKNRKRSLDASKSYSSDKLKNKRQNKSIESIKNSNCYHEKKDVAPKKLLVFDVNDDKSKTCENIIYKVDEKYKNSIYMNAKNSTVNGSNSTNIKIKHGKTCDESISCLKATHDVISLPSHNRNTINDETIIDIHCKDSMCICKRQALKDFEIIIENNEKKITKSACMENDDNIKYNLKTPNVRFKNFENINFIKDAIRVFLSNNCTLTHHLKILTQMQIEIKKFANNENNSNKRNYKDFFISGINSYKDVYKTIDFGILNCFNQFKKKSIIIDQSYFAYSNYLKNTDCNILNFIIENDNKFYLYLKMYINENLNDYKLTFNDIYVLVCCNVFKLDKILFKDVNYVIIKNEIISIFKASSIESLICFAEISKIILHLESTKEMPDGIEIEDFGIFFAFINVLKVNLKNKWRYNLSCKLNDDNYDDIKTVFYENKNKIIINEQRRQFFYMIMLYVLRPFVSNLRCLQTWHKNVMQGIIFTFNFKNDFSDEIFKSLHKLFTFQLLDILAFEEDTKVLNLSPLMGKRNRVLEILYFILQHKYKTSFCIKFINGVFREHIIQCISIFLNLLENNLKYEKNENLFTLIVKSIENLILNCEKTKNINFARSEINSKEPDIFYFSRVKYNKKDVENFRICTQNIYYFFVFKTILFVTA